MAAGVNVIVPSPLFVTVPWLNGGVPNNTTLDATKLPSTSKSFADKLKVFGVSSAVVVVSFIATGFGYTIPKFAFVILPDETVNAIIPSVGKSIPTLGVVPNCSPPGIQPNGKPNAGDVLPTVPAVVEICTE